MHLGFSTLSEQPTGHEPSACHADDDNDLHMLPPACVSASTEKLSDTNEGMVVVLQSLGSGLSSSI